MVPLDNEPSRENGGSTHSSQSADAVQGGQCGLASRLERLLAEQFGYGATRLPGRLAGQWCHERLTRR